MMKRFLAVPLYFTIVAAMFGGDLQAQTNLDIDRSILTLLPPRAPVLRAPNAAEPRLVAPEDSLTGEDYLVRSGRRVAAWQLTVSQPGDYQIDLGSNVFDPYLYIVGPGIRSLLQERGEDAYALTDDDGGEGYAARLCVPLSNENEYLVIVGALYAASGSYSLSVTNGCGVPIGGAFEPSPGDRDVARLSVPADRSLSVGYEAEGVLASDDPEVDGRHVQGWSLVTTGEESISIAVESDQFDAYLVVSMPDGRIFTDDDSGAGTNARIAVSAVEASQYRVYVTSYGGGTGTYRLRASRNR